MRQISHDERPISQVSSLNLQLIHQGRRHQLYRGMSQGRRSILKRTVAGRPEAQAIASLRHEYEVLHGLDLPGIVKVDEVTDIDGNFGLIMDDAGPTNLAEEIQTGPMPLTEVLQIAVQLAETVARMHAAHIVHLNINPLNVVWDPETRKATLVDFGMSTTLSSLIVESASPSRIEGHLSYIPPEQTGRTGRAVDSRSDLYSLGAMFYELLTGVPPFVAKDPIELIHAHLALRPRPPHDVNVLVPQPLSNVILKLLEKEPEHRYQTAEALALDLQEAAGQWIRTGSITSFPLARHDVHRTLRIPDKLYGRTEEIQTLREAFSRSANGHRELVLVTGAPGIGKSALVKQVEQPVIEQRGLFIVGKFDQLQRGIPYEGLVKAFRMLVRKLLTEPDPALQTWREHIQAAVAANGQVLIEVIPELERVIGPQLPVPELGPLEAKNRFVMVFTSFLRVFTRPEHPLALFVDDLQWADAASLKLIEQWTLEGESHHLLLLGAYRESEVNAILPFALSLKGLKEQGARIKEIHLRPLVIGNIAELLVETFNLAKDITWPFADLIVRKTDGNPFFVRRLLHVLHAERLIKFIPQTRSWEWDLGEIELAPVSDNVLDLMVRSISRLPDVTRNLLEAGACIGHRFDLGTLAEVMGLSRTLVTDQIWPALDDGLLVPISETYKAPRRSGPGECRLDELPGVVQFIHDRVQQAAYTMLSDNRKPKLHLDIGRRLLQSGSGGKLDERLFDIVDQFCLGMALLTDPQERLHLAELTLAAGRKAKHSAAHQAAFDYLTAGKRNLPERAWDACPELAFALYRELAESAYLIGKHDEAEELIRIGLERAPSKVAKMEFYSLRATAACAAGDNVLGLEAGREGLSLFSQEWPLEGLAEAIETEADAVMKNLGERRIEMLADVPEPRDEGIRACIRLLSVLGPPAYFSDSRVLAFVITRLTNLSLVHGPSEYSAYGYTFYGALHNKRTGDYETGYAFGLLALALARRFGNRREESRTVQVFGLIVNPWKAPLRTSMPLVKEGYHAGVESGELLYAALNLCAILIIGLPSGVPLKEFEEDVAASLSFSTKQRNTTSLELTLPYRQIVRCFTGRTHSPSTFDDAEFNEARFLADARSNLTALAFYWVNRLQAAYLVGDYRIARICAAEATNSLPSVMGMIREAEYVFYSALTIAALYDSASKSEKSSLLLELQMLHSKLDTWARHCPQNFRHKEQLVAAELAKTAQEHWQATKLYRAALEGAGREQFIQDKALAEELLGAFLLADGDLPAGSAYLRMARDDYRKWGALVKVQLLEKAHPNVFASEARVAVPEERKLPLDTLGLIKASQAISAEVTPEKLVERILRIVIEIAGAGSGTLLIASSGELKARGHATSDGAVATSFIEMPLADCPNLPHALIRYVARLKEPVVLTDARNEGPFTSDPTVVDLRLRSILCVPLKRKAELIGLLYLENNAMAGAFTSERVEIVQVLAGQAVISLENSTFLQEKMRLLAELQEADRRKDEFISTLAHELRNPLAPIRTGLELLRMTGDDPEMLEEVCSTMEGQIRHLVRLIDDLLDISRITWGKVTLRKERLELAEIVQHSVAATRSQIEEKGHRLIVKLPPKPICLEADATRLTQILSNLLTNAAKYTMNGGKIWLLVEEQGGEVAVTVKDTGIGIPTDMLEQIFEMFMQVDQSHVQAQGGLGIGLTLVKQMTELHGGSVEARSEGLGKGSEFIVRLPSMIEHVENLETSRDKTLTLPKKLRVLVVDDNKDAAKFLSLAVKKFGCEVGTAEDGLDAIDQAAEFHPDIVLMDIGMPRLNGYEAARRIRDQSWGKDMILIAVTGWGQEEDKRRTKESGFNHHLVKPVEFAALRKLLGDYQPSLLH